MIIDTNQPTHAKLGCLAVDGFVLAAFLGEA
jgi:hypothetical protein